MYRKIITIALISSLYGCATNRALGPVPTEPDEFKLPLASLRSNYHELDVYYLGNLFVGYCTPIEQLKKLWGEPNEVVTEWLQVPVLVVPIALAGGGAGGAIATGIVYGMYPKQPERYIWRKGNYEIETRVLTEIGCGYEPRIHHWQWNETMTGREHR